LAIGLLRRDRCISHEEHGDPGNGKFEGESPRHRTGGGLANYCTEPSEMTRFCNSVPEHWRTIQ